MPLAPPLSPDRLARALALGDVDARAAQRELEPAFRGPVGAGLGAGPPRPAASLAYLFPAAGAWWLPVTVRRDDLPEHRGQPCLPGGRPRGGETAWQTALREAEEEIGLDPAAVTPLGALAPVYIPPTHTDLTVCVGRGADPRPLRPAPGEVERLAVVALADLCDPRRRRERLERIAGRAVRVPYFDVEGLFLWGATAMALAELVARLRRVGWPTG